MIDLSPSRRCLLAVLLIWLPAVIATADDTPATRTISVNAFKTSSPPPAFVPPRDLRGLYSRFRPDQRSKKEGVLVEIGLQFGITHGRITKDQEKTLSETLGKLYDEIEADPAWKGIDSCLPFCYDEKPDGNGQYVMIVPDGADAKSPVVVFLHGFGGNFQSQIELVSRHLPEAIVLAPSWRKTWREGSGDYVEDMLADAKQKLGHDLRKPTLIGLSDGGQAAFRIVGTHRKTYARMASLAMSPRHSLVGKVPDWMPVLMINGQADDRVAIASARIRAESLSQRLAAFTFVELPGDHFFMALDPAATFAPIRKFMKLSADEAATE